MRGEVVDGVAGNVVEGRIALDGDAGNAQAALVQLGLRGAGDDDDPTIDLKTIRYPYMVGFRGRIFKKPRVKKYKNVEEKLDYIMEEVLTN